jgi:hypothetical protein
VRIGRSFNRLLPRQFLRELSAPSFFSGSHARPAGIAPLGARPEPTHFCTVPLAPYRRRPRRAVWRRSRPSRTGRWRRAELVAGKEQFSTAIGTHSPSPALSGRVAQRYEQLLRPGASGPNIQAPPLALTPPWISPRSRYTTSPGIADLVTRRPLTTCDMGDLLSGDRGCPARPAIPPPKPKAGRAPWPEVPGSASSASRMMRASWMSLWPSRARNARVSTFGANRTRNGPSLGVQTEAVIHRMRLGRWHPVSRP